jgi:hypothetical protein
MSSNLVIGIDVFLMLLIFAVATAAAWSSLYYKDQETCGNIMLFGFWPLFAIRGIFFVYSSWNLKNEN